jgi:TolB-like protein
VSWKPDPSVRTIAVLPFEPLVAQSSDEYLELGMADTLIGKLNSSGEIAARPLSSVRKFSGENRDATTIGRELGVDYVLEGTSRDRRIKYEFLFGS